MTLDRSPAFWFTVSDICMYVNAQQSFGCNNLNTSSLCLLKLKWIYSIVAYCALYRRRSTDTNDLFCTEIRQIF